MSKPLLAVEQCATTNGRRRDMQVNVCVSKLYERPPLVWVLQFLELAVAPLRGLKLGMPNSLPQLSKISLFILYKENCTTL